MTAAATIGDYAIIGDGRSAGLISRDGSLDWLCWPQFDSPALFGALLDRQVGGHWSITPVAAGQGKRRYLGETNVLETQFQTVAGSATLTDFMPVAAENQKACLLWPEQEIIRLAACESGEVELAIDFQPRPDFGRASFRIQDGGWLGLRIEIGSTLLTLRSNVRFDLSDRGATACLRLHAGESASFSLSRSSEGPAVIPLVGAEAIYKRELALDWWRQWTRQATYEGPYRDAVIRSALVLKLLSFAPSGAIVAAPTTSLPERLGGDLNWDYRFCWLRDGAFTARALFGLGFDKEAEAFVSWMLHATRLTRPELRVLYDVYGERPRGEAELPHLTGYAASAPVRIGNAARQQLQLDVYGQVIEAVGHVADRAGRFDRETQQMLRHFGSYVCRHWREADNGIWEPRGMRQHYAHSRLLCWVALDNLLNLAERGLIGGLPTSRIAEHRDKIRDDILHHAWNEELQSYTQTLGGRAVDATALLFALHDFEPAPSPRMQSTYQRLMHVLGAGRGLMYRNEQSFEQREATFALCGFWLAEFLARGGGPLSAAHEQMQNMLCHANAVGLFAEEIDARAGDAIGNFPQAFTHIGLINAALAISDREDRERRQATGDRRQSGTSMLFPVSCSPSPAPEVHR